MRSVEITLTVMKYSDTPESGRRISEMQKIAHKKNNGHELFNMAKTVGSDFFLLDKTITPKYKNGAYLALSAGGVAACATPQFPNMSELLPALDSIRTAVCENNY